MNKKSIGVHWFRRDLRIAGNQAFLSQWDRHEGRVLGFFCFDSVFLSREDFSYHRFAFFLETLSALKKELHELGGDLLVLDAVPEKAFPQLLKELNKSHTYELQKITFNRDYEPFARARDKKITELLEKQNVPVESFRDHLIFEPHEIDKGKAGEFYQVYSPFAKKWFKQFQTKAIQERITEQKEGLKYLDGKKSFGKLHLKWHQVLSSKQALPDQLEAFIKANDKKVTIPIPKAGSQAARERVKEFLPKLKDYKKDRDFPAVPGTSRFSMFFKNGSLTTSQVLAELDLKSLHFDRADGPTQFVKELVWREFYYHILYHQPAVETSAFLKKYQKLDWKKNKNWFSKWCEGQTGFPVVDAGMRELNTTGWMHNRVRMIVASFLCKDLLIDWREGENYFMKMLLDGDLAPNNGGWQWAASTGCDPQPYFRVFNPWLQGEKFDPEAEYIKTYVPELKNIDPKEIHDPEGDRGQKYPAPLVDHRQQKEKAIALYKKY